MSSAQLGLVLQHIRKMVAAENIGQQSDRQLLDDFLRQRDEASFAMLVKPHGPMVLNVCRSVLHHWHDAEDAFQATFLVPAQKADSIRQRETVGSWLCGVAHHLAVAHRCSVAQESE